MLPMKIRVLDGIEYAYVYAGAIQLYLGPVSKLNKADPKKLIKAINAYNGTIESQLEDYFSNVLECANLLDKKTKDEQIVKCRKMLDDMIIKLK